MEKSKLKTIIIILAIFLIISFALLIVFGKQKRKQQLEITDTETIKPAENNTTNEIGKKKSINNVDAMYVFCIKNCMQSYLDELNIDNPKYFKREETGNYISISEDEKKQNVYKLLSTDFIKKNNVTLENLYEFVKPIESKMMYNILDIKENKVDSTFNYKSYITYGLVQETSNLEKATEIYTIVTIDENNRTFAIIPLENKYKSIEEVEEQTISEQIEKHENNTFSYSTTKPEDIALYSFNMYKYTALAFPEYAYNNLLDEEYKAKRFNSLDEYKEFINNNIEKIKSMRIDKYKKNEKEEYDEYVCINQFNEYLIFNSYSIVDCKAILDLYTIDLPEFLDRYNSASSQGKVALNIQKFEQALNAKDYKFAYNCLSDGFKNNYFKSQENFENYIKQNWYNSSFNVSYDKFSEDTGLYKYTISIKNKENEQEKISKTIIMKLNDGTDFEMSFDV